MTDLEVLVEKTNNIQNCLKRIRDTLQGDLNRLDNFDVQDIIILNLQRAVQFVIDIATHIVSTEELGVPQTLKDLFQLLEKHQILEHDLSSKMQKMVGFRNIAVHDYQAINPAVLKSILSLHLQDIEDFYSTVIKREQKDYS
jgi:uncharacterized protein YutE (UPF0331/DUF86 family)